MSAEDSHQGPELFSIPTFQATCNDCFRRNEITTPPLPKTKTISESRFPGSRNLWKLETAKFGVDRNEEEREATPCSSGNGAFQSFRSFEENQGFYTPARTACFGGRPSEFAVNDSRTSFENYFTFLRLKSVDKDQTPKFNTARVGESVVHTDSVSGILTDRPNTVPSARSFSDNYSPAPRQTHHQQSVSVSQQPISTQPKRNVIFRPGGQLCEQKTEAVYISHNSPLHTSDDNGSTLSMPSEDVRSIPDDIETFSKANQFEKTKPVLAKVETVNLSIACEYMNNLTSSMLIPPIHSHTPPPTLPPTPPPAAPQTKQPKKLKSNMEIIPGPYRVQPTIWIRPIKPATVSEAKLLQGYHTNKSAGTLKRREVHYKYGCSASTPAVSKQAYINTKSLMGPDEFNGSDREKLKVATGKIEQHSLSVLQLLTKCWC